MHSFCLVPCFSSHASFTQRRPQDPAGWGQSNLHQGNAFSKLESFCAAYKRLHKTHLLNISEQLNISEGRAAFRGPQVRTHILKMKKLRPEEGWAQDLLFVKLTATSSAPHTSLYHTCLPVSGPLAGSCGQKKLRSQLPSPVGVAPDPGAGDAFQSVHHRVPIVQKGFVQPGGVGIQEKQNAWVRPRQ